MSLEDIQVTPLQRIETVGGDVLHALRHTDAGFVSFGEAYFSLIAHRSVKAWKRHNRMTMNLIVPKGTVKLVFSEANDDGTRNFRVEEIGEDPYSRVTVPPGIWFGFQGIAAPESLILNIASIPHDPDEVERLALTDILYAWG